MVWNLRVGMKVRYQEELPACWGSQTWVRIGEGEKENLWTHLLGLSIRGGTFPLLCLLPSILSVVLWKSKEPEMRGVGGNLDSFWLCYFFTV